MLRFDETGHPSQWARMPHWGRTTIPETRLGGSRLRWMAPDEAAAGRRLEGGEGFAGSEPNCWAIGACQEGAVNRQ